MTQEKATQVSMLWRRVNRRVHERLRQAFEGWSMPPMGPMLLGQIKKAPGSTASDLCRQTGFVKSHISRLLDQLVEEGYVEKRDDPHDQRLQRLYPTDSAEAVFKEAEQRAKEAWQEILKDAPEGQIDEVIRVLETLLKALKEGQP